MPSSTDLELTDNLIFRGRKWYRNLVNDKRSKTVCSECCLTNACDQTNYVEKGHMKFIKSRSIIDSTTSRLTNSTSETSLSDSQTKDKTVNLTAQHSMLITFIISAITLIIFLSLFYLLFLLWRRRAKNFAHSYVGKEEIIEGQPLSLESTLLNHTRTSEDSNVGPTKLSHENALVSDIEKELMVEPPLNSHPALKFIDTNNPHPPHPGTRVFVPEIPSPLPSPICQHETSMRSSFFPPAKASPKSETFNCDYSLVNADLSLQPTESSGRDIFRGNVYENPSSKVNVSSPSLILEKGYQNKCEVIKEETEDGSIQVDCTKSEINSKSETHPWHHLFSKITHPSSPELKTMDTTHSATFISGTHHKEPPIVHDGSDQVHLISDRWSRSTLELPDSPTNFASEWYIPGSWINSARLDNVNIHASETAHNYDDIVDANQSTEPKKVLSLNLRTPKNYPNTTALDCHKSRGAEDNNERDNDDDENNNGNYSFDTKFKDSETGSSEARTWRKWLKR